MDSCCASQGLLGGMLVEKESECISADLTKCSFLDWLLVGRVILDLLLVQGVVTNLLVGGVVLDLLVWGIVLDLLLVRLVLVSKYAWLVDD